MGAEKQYVVFRLEGQRYGASVDVVREVTYVTTVTRLPNTPAYVEGVVDLRGEVIPVINLRRRLGMPPGEQQEEERLMILTLGDRTAAVRVDGVDEVLSFPGEAILPPDPTVSLPGQEYVAGLARRDGEIVVMLDMAALLGPAS